MTNLIFLGLQIASLLNSGYDTIKIPSIDSRNFDAHVCAVSPLATSKFRADSLIYAFHGRILFKDLLLNPNICPEAKFTVFIGCKNDSISIGIDLNHNNIFETNEIKTIPAKNKTVLSYNIFPKEYCNINDLVDSTVIHLIPFVNLVHYSDVSGTDTMLQISYSKGFIKKFRINDTLELESHSTSLKRIDSSFTFRYTEKTPSGVFAIYPDRDLLYIQDHFYSIIKSFNKDTLYLAQSKTTASKTKITEVSVTFLNGLNPIELKMKKPKKIQFKKKLILLDFWATYCAPCIAAMPKVQELNKKFGSKIQIISLCVDVNRNFNEARQLSKENILNFEHYFIPEAVKLDDTLVKFAGIIAYPTYILLNNKGIVLKIVNDISSLDLMSYYNLLK